jgi:hypothetical protein
VPEVDCRRLYAVESRFPGEGAIGRLREVERRALRHLRSDPEGLRRWIRDARRRLRRVEADERPDLVYAIGLPTAMLTAGAAIAADLDLPLIADIGDPWAGEGRAERRERDAVLAAAAGLVTTTLPLAEQFQPLLRPGAPVVLAPAGGELRRRAGSERERPLIVHLGTINEGRIAPEPAYEALAALHAEGVIEFRSHVGGWREGLHELPHPHLPLLDHAAALDLTAEASAALVLGNVSREQLPSKAYEIACTETWALCVCDRDDDPTVTLLERTGHAICAPANERGAITSAVQTILARELRGDRPTPDPAQAWEGRIDEIAEFVERVGRGVPAAA